MAGETDCCPSEPVTKQIQKIKKLMSFLWRPMVLFLKMNDYSSERRRSNLDDQAGIYFFITESDPEWLFFQVSYVGKAQGFYCIVCEQNQYQNRA